VTASAPSPELSTRHRTLVNLVFALVGGALLVVTVRRVGWADVERSISSVGWWYVPIVALGGIRFAARTRAWQLCADLRSLTFSRLFSATLTADALGNLTPLGLLASEPAKVYFVKDRVELVPAVASVTAENAFYIVSVLVMIAAGAIVFFERAPMPPALVSTARLAVAAMAVTAVIAVWIGRRRPAILSRLAQRIARWSGRRGDTSGRFREFESRIYGVFSWPASRIARVLSWEALFHLAAFAEVVLVLRLLPGGGAGTWLDAFVLESAGRLIIVLFKFVPYRLGVDEAGTAMVAGALGLDPAVGVALALVRRVRVLCWNVVGLGLLAARR